MKRYLILFFISSILAIFKLFAQEIEPCKNCYALIYGIHKFRNKEIDTLQFAHKDARDFYNFLKTVIDTDNIKYRIDEDFTLNSVTSDDNGWINDKLLENNNKGKLYIFISGHGNITTITQEPYIYFFDTPKKELPSSSSGLDAKFFENIIKVANSHNKEVILILDVCKSGEYFSSFNKIDPKINVQIYACEPGENSIEDPSLQNGIFTRMLLIGIQGGCIDNKSGVIAVKDLSNFLKINVTNRAAKFNAIQNPKIEGPSNYKLFDVSPSMKIMADNNLKTLPQPQSGKNINYKAVYTNYYLKYDSILALKLSILSEKIEKNYLLGNGDGAWELYSELINSYKNDSALSIDLKSLKSRLISASTNQAQLIVNRYVSGSNNQPPRSAFKQASQLLKNVFSLLGPEHLITKAYQPKQMFLEACSVAEYYSTIDTAISLLNKSIELDSNASYCYNYLGAIYTDLDDFRQAEKNIKKAIEIDPKWVFPHNQLAYLYILMGKTKKAEKELLNFLKVSPSSCYLYRQLSYLYYYSGNYSKAENYLIKAIDFNNNDSIFLSESDWLYSQIYSYKLLDDNAKKKLEEGIRYDSVYDRNYIYLGKYYMDNIYSDTLSFNLAERCLMKSLSLSPNNFEALIFLGGLYFKRAQNVKNILDSKNPYKNQLDSLMYVFYMLQNKLDKYKYDAFNSQNNLNSYKNSLDNYTLKIDTLNIYLEKLNNCLSIAYNEDSPDSAFKSLNAYNGISKSFKVFLTDTNITNSFPDSLVVSIKNSITNAEPMISQVKNEIFDYQKSKEYEAIETQSKSDLKKADSIYQKAIEINPHFIWPYEFSRICNFYLYLGDTVKALNLILKIDSIKYFSPMVAEVAGDFFLNRLIDTNRAIKYYLSGIARDSFFINNYVDLSNCYTALSQPDKSREYLQSANNIAPDESSIFYSISKTYWEKDSIPVAKSFLLKGLESDPDFVSGINTLISIYITEDSLFEAYKYFKLLQEKSIPYEYNNGLSNENISYRNLNVNPYDKGYNNIQINNFDSLLNITMRKYQIEDNINYFLVEIIGNIIRKTPEPEFFIYLGNYFSNNNNNIFAKEWFGKALKLDPTAAQAHSGLINTLLKEDSLIAALDYYNSVKDSSMVQLDDNVISLNGFKFIADNINNDSAITCLDLANKELVQIALVLFKNNKLNLSFNLFQKAAFTNDSFNISPIIDFLSTINDKDKVYPLLYEFYHEFRSNFKDSSKIPTTVLFSGLLDLSESYGIMGIEIYNLFSCGITLQEIYDLCPEDDAQVIKILDFIVTRFAGDSTLSYIKDNKRAEDKIYKKFGIKGLKIYELIDGVRTAKEILDSVSVTEKYLTDVLEYMESQGLIKLNRPLPQKEKKEYEPVGFQPMSADNIILLKDNINFRKGIIAYKIKNYYKSIEFFSKAIKDDSTNIQFYNERGSCYYSEQDFQNAIIDYTKSIDINKNSFKSYYNRGLAYACLQDYVKSTEDFTQYLKLKPNDPLVLHLRGLAYDYMNSLDNAISDYTMALSILPGYKECRNHLEIAKAKKH